MTKVSIRRPRDAKDARAMAIVQFGHKPSAEQVLQAYVETSPGPQYTGWVHPDVILAGAQMALVDVAPVERTLDISDKRLADLREYASQGEGFANNCIWKGELSSILTELLRYRAAAGLGRE